MAQLHPNAQPQQKTINAMIRVNQAGEYGALQIYAGQLKGLKDASTQLVIHHMVEQERHHLNTFNALMKKHHISPTVFTPLWRMGGYMLGYLSAKLSCEHAMACTVAVEEVIDQHYAAQIHKLSGIDTHNDLRDKLIQFRQEELEHRDIGLDYITQPFVGQQTFSFFVKSITKLAIKLSQRM